ncbi:MAG: nucleoside triphosphate pyrophosphohydrolase [Alphaproteobacteria bacterium]
MTAQLNRLLDIMARLRDPETGCPWDVQQDFASIAPYTIEEAYEVADAIEQGDMAALREELGDLLLQVVFHARMAEEQRVFDFNAVAKAIADKMVRRHPHVFGDASFNDEKAQRAGWESQKAEERAAKAAKDGRVPSVLDGVPGALPALMRSEKLGRRAARVGFEWPDIAGAVAKLDEEIAELKVEAAAPAPDTARLKDEIGDVLFSVVNVARHLDIDPEDALRHANAKFERRFHAVEQGFTANGIDIADADLDTMEERWQAAKIRGL